MNARAASNSTCCTWWSFLAFAVFVLAVGCKRAEKQAPVREQAAKQDTLPPAAPTPSPQWPADLPRLKDVITTPFPEGVTEAQVCEAIDNTKEKDLWLRFGHFIPMYRLGAVYVIDGAEKEAKIIEDFVSKHYIPGMFRPDWRLCPGKGLLLYLSSMQEKGDFYGNKFGREHFAEQLALKGLTVRESYQSPLGERLGEYCRQDAELCERLVKMDRTNEGKGLCRAAEEVCWKLLENDPSIVVSWTVLCGKTPSQTLACLEYARAASETASCRQTVRDVLCSER